MKELKSSVQKTFALLEHFTVQKPEWGVTELASAIGSNKSTVYRFLADLLKLGVLHKNPDTEKYSLGLKLFELGNRVKLKSAFTEKTHPVLIEVAKSITETVHIAVLKDFQIFHLDKVESPQGLKLSSHIGGLGPAYCTALGKVLLAYLPEREQDRALAVIYEERSPIAYTRHTIVDLQQLKSELATVKNRAYAVDKEEAELGLICVGIPIFNQNDEIIAGLSASGPASRFEEDKVASYVATLQKGAAAIRQEIGYFKL